MAAPVITVPLPAGFSFKRTAISHGWYDLDPFSLDRETWTLKRVLDLRTRVVTVSILSNGFNLLIKPSARIGKKDEEKVVQSVRHMLRLDDDLSGFYQAVRADSRFSWISLSGAGRLLRSPTVFEDVVKMICTTNCSWALTDKMVAGLVQALGEESSDGSKAFPTPQAMAEQPTEFYRNHVRAGYRAPYLKELADRVSSGELNLEVWLKSELPTSELQREMKRIKGVGDYAAENLLKLVGRYDGLALDSWVRAQFARMRGNGRKCSDKKIEKYYSGFGGWRGLVLWCDMTRAWLDDERGEW